MHLMGERVIIGVSHPHHHQIPASQRHSRLCGEVCRRRCIESWIGLERLQVILSMKGRISLQSDPEREYDSIAAAVEAASSSSSSSGRDTVVLGAGEYNERIVMGKSVKIAASVEAAEGEVRCPSLMHQE
jgi:hypothetical protein